MTSRFALNALLLLGFGLLVASIAEGTPSGRRGNGRGRRREWDSMHHVVRDLLTARIDPVNGKPCDVAKLHRGTALDEAEGIYTALGRTRVAKRNNKLRFSLKGLVSSRVEDFPGKAQPGYMVPDVFHAEVRIFKTPSRLPPRQRQSGARANITVTSPMHRGAVGQSLVSLSQNRWEVIDVTDFIRGILQSPTRGIDLAFHAHSADGNGRRLATRSLFALNGSRSNTQRPVLIVYLKEPVDPLEYILVKAQEASDEVEARKKRAVAMPEENALVAAAPERQRRTAVGEPRPSAIANSTEIIDGVLDHGEIRNDLCGLHSMYLDFSSIGWDHILAPEGFDPRTCRGVCMDPLTSSTNHAIVRSWAYRHSHPELEGQPVPTVCCIPTQFSSMTLVIQEEHGDILKSDIYFDMTAEACGCR